MALNKDRHPEVAAKRPSKDARPTEIGLSDFGDLLVLKSATANLSAVALRGSLRSHLRVTEQLIGNTMADFFGLMKQAAELKSKMEAMQAELDRIEVEGTAGGGLLTLTLSGKGEVRGAHIDESLLKPDQKDIVQDLIIAAHADARRKLEVLLQERMQALTGGLPLPPGLKLF
jgi:nucleoid-associated protein EbfC